MTDIHDNMEIHGCHQHKGREASMPHLQCRCFITAFLFCHERQCFSQKLCREEILVLSSTCFRGLRVVLSSGFSES